MAKQTTPMDKIRADLERKYNAAVRELAEEVTFQVEKAYESVISKFYNEYTPKRYQRTQATIKASNRWDDIFGVNVTGDGFESGITVGSENIKGEPYRAKKSWVFPRTYEEGIHGYFKLEAQEWAKKRIQSHVWSKKKTNREMRRMERMINSAPKFYRSPKQGMDKLFKTICTDRYLDRIAKEKLNEAFR